MGIVLRAKIREIAVGAWGDYSGSSKMAKKNYDTHIDFMKKEDSNAEVVARASSSSGGNRFVHSHLIEPITSSTYGACYSN